MRIRNGGVSQLQYNFGSADAWRYRGGEHSGKFTPIPRQFPVEGVTYEEIRENKGGNKTGMKMLFNFPLLLPRLRVLSVYRYTSLSTDITANEILTCVHETLPELPPTLETLDLRFDAAWFALLDDSSNDVGPTELSTQARPGLSMLMGRYTLANSQNNNWRPLRTLFPGLRHLIVSSGFAVTYRESTELAQIEPLLARFIDDALPSTALELIDVDFLPPMAYSKLSKDSFPRMDCLSISTLSDSSWSTLLEIEEEAPEIPSMWTQLPLTLSRLVVPTLTLSLAIMKMLPKMLSELEVKIIDQEMDPYLVSLASALNPDLPDLRRTNIVRPDDAIIAEENDEDLFLSRHPCEPLPLPPYLSCLTTSHSFYWTRTLARRVPASVSVFRLRKAFYFQMRTFTPLPATVSSFVIYSMSQESGTRGNINHQLASTMMGLNMESLLPLATSRLEYLRIASSAGAIKCKLPFEANMPMPLFAHLESLVLPRATLSEDCLLALPRTLRRLDVERIRATGSLLHYFHEERKVRTGLTEREVLFSKTHERHVPNSYLPANYMERLTDYFVRGTNVPAKYYDDPLYTRPIEIVNTELLERAITVFCNVHFPGLQAFLPPIHCLSVSWVPDTTTEIHLDSTLIPIGVLPCLQRIGAHNMARYVGFGDIKLVKTATELDWRMSNTNLRLLDLKELPRSVTRLFGNQGCCVFDPTWGGDSARSGRSPDLERFSWRIVNLVDTTIGSYYLTRGRTPPQLDGAASPQQAAQSDDQFSESATTAANTVKIPKWRQDDIAHPIKRLTIPDDIGRANANLMHLEFCAGASVHYDLSGRFPIRTFPHTLNELILRGTGFQGVKWSPPAPTSIDPFEYLHSGYNYDATFSACVEVPATNTYLGKSLFFRPWNYIEPSTATPTAATHKANTQAANQHPISLNSSGKSRYNDRSGIEANQNALYPSVLTQVKLIFGAIAHYPLNLLPSWLTRLHFERHLIRPSIFADMTDFLPNLATLIITNGCLLATDFDAAVPSAPSATPKVITIGGNGENPGAAFTPWDGDKFAYLLPKTLTKLVVDCLDLPYWTEADYAQLPPGLTELYLSPNTKNDEKEILAWIATHHGSKSLETSDETQWLSTELAKRYPPELRGSEGIGAARPSQ